MKTMRFTFGLLCAVFALVAFAAPARADFLYRSDLTVAGIPSGTTLTDFPVLVRLDKVTGFAFNQILTADASDLAFADADDNPLAWEVDTFNASAGKLLVWVKLPSATTNTAFKAYWGNASPPAHTPSDVWTAYKGVWHLNDLSDSTANGYTLTKYNSGTTLNTDGKLGACYTIAPAGATRGGSHGLVALGTTNATLGSAFTISGWLRHAGTSTSWDHIFYRRTGSQETDGGGFVSEINNTTLTSMNVYGASKTITSATVPMAKDTWAHLALAFNGTSLTVYGNGVGSAKTLNAAPTDNGRPLSFGNNWNPTTQVPNDYFWIGEMDELRVYPATASAAQMAAEYATLANEAFLTYGTTEVTDTTMAAITVAPTLSRTENGTVTLAATVAGKADTTYRIFAVYNDAVTNEIAAVWAPTTGNLTTNILSTATGLAADRTYAVTLYADNGATAASATSDDTFLTGDVAVVAGDDALESGTVPGTFLVSRPAGSDQQPLVVNYTITSATATPGVSYAIPAGAAVTTGNTITGSVTIVQGAPNATVSVKPKVDAALQEDATIAFTLTSGLYGIASGAASAEITLVNLLTDPNFNTWIAGVAGKASESSNWSYGRTPISTDAVLFDGRFSTANCEWDVANGGNVATVASWTQMPDYTGTVMFNTTFAAADTTLTNLVITGDCIVSNGVWTHPVATADTHAIAPNYYRLAVKVGGAMTLASAATINLTGKGTWYSLNSNSHGGQGSHGTPFGSHLEPTALGRSTGTADNPAFGGGALALDVVGVFAMNGAITANGTASGSYAGSGGSVFIKAASMTGAGTIAANGIAASSTRVGSGGRIAILLTGSAALGVPEANLTAYGSSIPTISAGAGTIVIRTTSTTYGGRLIVRDKAGKYDSSKVYAKKAYSTPILAGETWTLDSIAFGSLGILRVPAGTTLNLPNGLASVDAPSALGGLRTCGLLIDGGTLVAPQIDNKHVISGPWTFSPNGPYELTGDVVVTNGGALGVVRVWNPLTNDYTRLDLTVHGNLSVSTNSYLLADDAGLAGASYGVDYSAIFPGSYVGAHGGAYGNRGYTTTHIAYDSILAPSLPGNTGNANPQRVGGGLLTLKVGGTLTLDGTASARVTIRDLRMGGQGTINIEAARLAGAGTMSVSGYEDDNYFWTQDPELLVQVPGGGRIAVRLTDPSASFSDWWKTNITARGVALNPTSQRLYHSSAGTVYLQDGTQAEGAGMVYIAQNGSVCNWTTACTNDLTAFPSTRHGGENDNFKDASLDISGGAHVLVTRNVVLKNLAIAEHSTIELNGNTVAVKNCALGGQRLGGGTYSAADELVAAYLDDASVGAGGKLVVMGDSTVWVVR